MRCAARTAQRRLPSPSILNSYNPNPASPILRAQSCNQSYLIAQTT